MYSAKSASSAQRRSGAESKNLNHPTRLRLLRPRRRSNVLHLSRARKRRIHSLRTMCDLLRHARSLPQLVSLISAKRPTFRNRRMRLCRRTVTRQVITLPRTTHRQATKDILMSPVPSRQRQCLTTPARLLIRALTNDLRTIRLRTTRLRTMRLTMDLIRTCHSPITPFHPRPPHHPSQRVRPLTTRQCILNRIHLPIILHLNVSFTPHQHLYTTRTPRWYLRFVWTIRPMALRSHRGPPNIHHLVHRSIALASNRYNTIVNSSRCRGACSSACICILAFQA